ncbi:MAG: translocation/assembly module TamB domain-containing protein [Bryobacteraceae bacterium]|jgi:translocation and assembly module TamB
MTRQRIAWIAAGGLAGLVLGGAVAAVLVLRSAWFYEQVRERVVNAMETATGGRVEAGSFQFDWKRLRAEIRMLAIHGTEPPGKPPLFRARTVAVGLKIISILERRVDIQYLEVVEPRIFLTIDSDGRTNLPAPKIHGGRTTAETILNLAIGRFSLQNGVFEIESRGQVPFDARGRNLNAKFLYERAGPRYRGDFSMQPLEVAWGSYGPVPLDVAMAVTFEGNRIGVTSAKVATGDSHIDFSGAVDDLVSPRGSFRYDVRASLADVARIFRVEELRRGTAEVAGNAVWAGSSNYSANGRLHAYGVEYRDSFVRLDGFHVDGSLAAGKEGIRLSDVRLSGNEVNSTSQVPADARIATAGLRGRDLEFHGVAVDTLGGSFRGEVLVRNLDRYTVTGEIADFEARRVVALYSAERLPWDSLVSGQVSLEGSLLRPIELRVSTGLNLAPMTESPPVHGQIAASYEARSGILDLGPSSVTLPSSRAVFSGAFGREMRVQLESRDLDDLLPALGQSAARLPAKLASGGGVVFDGTVTGKLDDPRIAGHLHVTRFSYLERGFDSLDADVNASPGNLGLRNAALARGPARAQFELAVGLSQWKTRDGSLIFGKGTIRDVPLADLAALAGAQSTPVTGTLNATAQLTGTVGNPLLNADIDLIKGVIRNEPFDRFTAGVSYSGHTVGLASGQLTAGAKQIRLSATFDRAPDRFDAGRLRFQVTSNAMPLEQIHALQEARPGLNGTVQVTADGDVELGQPGFRITDLHADVWLRGLQWTGEPLRDIHLTANSDGPVLRAHLDSGVADSTVRGDGEWRLEGDYPGSATVSFSSLDLARLRVWMAPSVASAASRFAGSAEGQLRIDGPALKPQLMKAELRISKFEIGPAPDAGLPTAAATLHNSGPLVASMANSVVTVESARLVGGSSDFSITGKLLFDRKSALDLRVSGRVDLAIVREFSHDLISSGTLAADATVRGPFDAPQVNGRMDLHDAAMDIAGLPNGISRASGVVLFTGDRATIQSLSGETGGGRIEISGFAGYSGGPVIFRLHAQATQVRVRYPEGVSNIADASLNLTGTSDRSMIAGTITVRRAGFNPESDIGSLLANSAEPVRTPSARTGFLGGLNFDVQINTAADTQFETSLTENLQAEANLRLRGTASNPALIGRINITQGQMVFFGTKFTINQGSIAFYNPLRVEPVLDVDLETKARGVDIMLTVSGPLDKLNLTPRSDPPLQFSEIVALLATGRDPTSDPALLAAQSTTPQTWQQMGASALLGQAIASPVAGRLQRFFGVSNLRIDPMSPGVENNPQARLTLEQQVTPDLIFTYITNVTTSNPQVVQVEWALSRQWSAVVLREENGLLGLDFFYKRRFK